MSEALKWLTMWSKTSVPWHVLMEKLRVKLWVHYACLLGYRSTERIRLNAVLKSCCTILYLLKNNAPYINLDQACSVRSAGQHLVKTKGAWAGFFLQTLILLCVFHWKLNCISTTPYFFYCEQQSLT